MKKPIFGLALSLFAFANAPAQEHISHDEKNAQRVVVGKQLSIGSPQIKYQLQQKDHKLWLSSELISKEIKSDFVPKKVTFQFSNNESIILNLGDGTAWGIDKETGTWMQRTNLLLNDEAKKHLSTLPLERIIYEGIDRSGSDRYLEVAFSKEDNYLLKRMFGEMEKDLSK